MGTSGNWKRVKHQFQQKNYFQDLLIKIDQQTTLYLIKSEIRQNIERKQVVKNTQTNSSEEKTTKSKPKVVNKIGRNQPCPCGSGRKYKQCCGK